MKLRRTIFGAAMGALLSLAGTQGADAQIYDQYTLSIQPRQYMPQAARIAPIPRNSFVDIFAPNVVDADNGVAGPISLGFPFEYNGQTFTQIYISVNGWISFQKPTTGGAGFFGDDPLALFNNSRPNLTVAPYYGDHYMRVPGFDGSDPGGRSYIPTFIRAGQRVGAGNVRDTFIVEWENLNINYRFNPNDPTNPFAPNQQPQATSVATFQLYLIEADTTCATREGSIEFHYGPIGTAGIVKTQGASVGIEDEPAVGGGQTTFMNAVAFRETGGNFDSTILSRRLTTTWPPAGFPGQVFRFDPSCNQTISGWGDGDADLTQLNTAVPDFIRLDQRRFVTFQDVIRILRHQATRNVEFDHSYGRHAFHGDVNHDGRYYFSTRNYNNTADSVNSFGQIVRYVVLYPIKSTNYQTPFPNDNSFNGFLYEADQHDAALIMLYLAAKLPVLPWLPDTLPHFTGKRVPGQVASDVVFGHGARIGNRTIEIPVTFDGLMNGAMGVGLEATNGTRIVEVRPAAKTPTMWVEGVASNDRVAITAAGVFSPDQVVATIVVEANEEGEITFSNLKVGDQQKGMRRMNISGASTGAANSLNLSQNFPNPMTVNSITTISYSVPTDGAVTLRVFDVLGHEIATLVDGTVKAGSYTIDWNGVDATGKPVGSGVYYYRLEAAGQSRTMSMQVSK